MPATKKPIRIPRKELTLICSLADAMANCVDYMEFDENGPLGRDPKIDRALDKVRRVFAIKQPTKERSRGQEDMRGW
jgi:hypothetical protein